MSEPMTPQQAQAEAERIIREAFEPATVPAAVTAYRDDTAPVPTGAAPVAQPGRPPMSQRATDASGLMLSGSVAAVATGGSLSLVLWTLGHADPTALAVGAAGPVALVLAAVALVRAIGRARSAVTHTTTITNQYGPVTHTEVTSTAKGLVARTRTEVKR